jgi:hypothetical protein
MDCTHIGVLKNVWNIIELKGPKGRRWKNRKRYKESMTEKRNQRELLWFKTGGALNFITTVPHCGEIYI